MVKLRYNYYVIPKGGRDMIRFENVSKKFKSYEVLKNVSFSINEGELVVLIGESGCGKTTMIKMINRIIKQTSGDIFIKGENVNSFNEVKLRRQIGYVIQQTGLFPHMTVRENIELIPRLESNDRKKVAENTIKLMKMVGLDVDRYLDQYPSDLSGGQQQRVGVARAFAVDPDIILMDEPFSALDPITKSDLQDELVHLQSKMKKTVVFVTHDMSEAIKIADRICIIQNGEILQYDVPENILNTPFNEYVSNFVGKNRIWSSPEYIKISDIMLDKPMTVPKDLTVLRCLEKMRQCKIDSLLVIDYETHKLLGIVKASILRAIENRNDIVEMHMKTGYHTLSPDDNILDAMKYFKNKNRSVVPVIDDEGVLKGLITTSSLVTVLSKQYFDCIDDEVEE